MQFVSICVPRGKRNAICIPGATLLILSIIQINNARNAIAGCAGFRSRPKPTTNIYKHKITHLRIEALGHDVVVVRRLLGHGGQWGTRGAFLGLVNEEPICRIENSNCGKFELHVSYEKYRERQNFQHTREDTNTE